MGSTTPRGNGSSRRDEVLRHALELFRAHGYEGTSLRQIADRLGVTKAAVYYHFPAKDHLLKELTEPFAADLERLLADSGAGVVDDAARVAVLSRYLDVFIDHHAVVSYLSQDAAAVRHPDVGRRLRGLIEQLTMVIAVDDSLRSRVVAACALGAVNSVSTFREADLDVARPMVLNAAVAALTSCPRP